MQEEVTQKTIALVIKTAKLDANVLKAAMRMYLNHRRQATLQYGDLDGYVKGSISAIQTHMKHLLEEPAGKAIYRIVQYMGYQDYLTRSEIKDNKLDTLRIQRL